VKTVRGLQERKISAGMAIYRGHKDSEKRHISAMLATK